MMSIENIEAKAEKTLRETDSYRVPVPINIVAERLNIKMEALPLKDISGILVVKGRVGGLPDFRRRRSLT